MDRRLRRHLGAIKNDEITLVMRRIYAEALYLNDGATLDDLREAVSILEETERTARRALGISHPGVVSIGRALRNARAALHAREAATPGGCAN